MEDPSGAGEDGDARGPISDKTVEMLGENLKSVTDRIHSEPLLFGIGVVILVVTLALVTGFGWVKSPALVVAFDLTIIVVVLGCLYVYYLERVRRASPGSVQSARPTSDSEGLNASPPEPNKPKLEPKRPKTKPKEGDAPEPRLAGPVAAIPATYVRGKLVRTVDVPLDPGGRLGRTKEHEERAARQLAGAVLDPLAPESYWHVKTRVPEMDDATWRQDHPDEARALYSWLPQYEAGLNALMNRDVNNAGRTPSGESLARAILRLNASIAGVGDPGDFEYWIWDPVTPSRTTSIYLSPEQNEVLATGSYDLPEQRTFGLPRDCPVWIRQLSPTMVDEEIVPRAILALWRESPKTRPELPLDVAGWVLGRTNPVRMSKTTPRWPDPRPS